MPSDGKDTGTAPRRGGEVRHRRPGGDAGEPNARTVTFGARAGDGAIQVGRFTSLTYFFCCVEDGSAPNIPSFVETP